MSHDRAANGDPAVNEEPAGGVPTVGDVPAVGDPERARFWRSAALPGVDLLKARYVTHRFSPHAHEGYAIAMVLSGVEEFFYRGAVHRAGAGSLSTLDPEEAHDGYPGVPGGWSYRVLYPSVGFVSGIAAELMAGRGTPCFPEVVTHHPPTVALLRAAHDAAERGDDLASSTLARTAFAALLRHHAARRPPEAPVTGAGRPAVLQAREILHERLVDPPTVEDLARAVGTSPFALMRAFKAATGLPPHAYLNTLRIMEARRLLRAGMPPARVAGDVGFTDQAHLGRHFKRIVGVPPAAYQRAGTYKSRRGNRT
ncbi:AraC family transcriptional regulator [Streptosporangium sp. NPDC023615]|uniref:AraC family transcriptional regulator n=1 Tax=Streptosporangium sp. NPDC023615 TaxID=3154794 RepID=UPI003442A40E